jgi:outer membrane protein assembly factor BamD
MRLLKFPRTVCALALCAALSATAGCSSKPKPAPGDQAAAGSATDEQIFIGDTIEKNYDPNVIIKRAESFFEKEEYAEAIIEYQHFLVLHKVHQLAPYAQYRLGESHFMMIKTHDRDGSPVAQALAAFEKLLRDFPGSQWEADAQEKIRACNNTQAQTMLFVGKFYHRREAYLAASHRFEAILKQYPDHDVAEESLYYLASSYYELGLGDWAREALTVFNDRFPKSKFAADSRKLMARVNSRPGEPASVPSPVAGIGATLNTANVYRAPEAVPTGPGPIGATPSSLR